MLYALSCNIHKKMYMTTCRCKLAYDWVNRCQHIFIGRSTDKLESINFFVL